ncbi:MAG TPA: hypothetical protein VKB81_10165, partial [Nitrospira sp.]|nr:hypothetical protein [Nitrospira sp.]
ASGSFGFFGSSLIAKVYTRVGKEGALFEGFQRGFLREGALAIAAGYEIDGLANGHGGTEIQAYTTMVAGGARDFLEPIRHVRLRAEIELHVGVDWKTVEAFLADATPFAICLHKPLIDPEAGSLADGALHCCQPRFDFLNCQSRHCNLSTQRKYSVQTKFSATQCAQVSA